VWSVSTNLSCKTDLKNPAKNKKIESSFLKIPRKTKKAVAALETASTKQTYHTLRGKYMGYRLNVQDDEHNDALTQKG